MTENMPRAAVGDRVTTPTNIFATVVAVAGQRLYDSVTVEHWTPNGTFRNQWTQRQLIVHPRWEVSNAQA